jgi:hypothetical protein
MRSALGAGSPARALSEVSDSERSSGPNAARIRNARLRTGSPCGGRRPRILASPPAPPAPPAPAGAAAPAATLVPAATAPAPAPHDGSLLDRLSASREALQAQEMQAEISQADLPGCIPIAQTRHRDVVDVTGTLRTVTLRPRGPSLTMEADLWDGTGNITLVWLGRRDIPGIEPGRRILVHGRLASIKGEPTIFNPQYELRPSGGDRAD